MTCERTDRTMQLVRDCLFNRNVHVDYYQLNPVLGLFGVHVCVRGMKDVDIYTMSCEDLVADCKKCRSALKQLIKTREDKLVW